MPGAKIETLTFAEIRKFAKTDPTQLNQGEGWKMGEEVPLSKDFYTLALDFSMNWLHPQHAWSLREVLATLETSNSHPQNTKHAFGERIEIIPDKLTTILTFGAKNPPTQAKGWSRRRVLDLKEAINYNNKNHLYLEEIHKGRFDTDYHLGPLLKFRHAVMKADAKLNEAIFSPYYLLGEQNNTRSNSDSPHTIEIDPQNPASQLIVKVYAEDLEDRLRRDSNQFKRVQRRMRKNFPLT